MVDVKIEDVVSPVYDHVCSLFTDLADVSDHPCFSETLREPTDKMWGTYERRGACGREEKE